ncbi:MAG: HzsA-related protein, partial [Thermoguttaceae bacterium]
MLPKPVRGRVAFPLVVALIAMGASAAAAAEEAPASAATLTPERIEADWLRQDEVRGLPVPEGVLPVTAAEDAAGACDGVRTGSYGFHTGLEDRPWWQVDLGRSARLDQILIYNRCDGSCRRAARLKVLLSLDGQSWQTVYQHDGTLFYGHADARPLSVKLQGDRARFVKIELPEPQTCLHLDEVEVYPQGNHRNIALACAATQSSVSPCSQRERPAIAKVEPFSPVHGIDRGRRLAESLRRIGTEVDDQVAALDEAAGRWASLPQDAPLESKRDIYLRARRAVREMTLRNPLLDFDRVLFVEREPARFKVNAKSGWYTHMSDQYYGWFTRPGGGLYVLEGFKTDRPSVRCLTPSLTAGSIVRPELSYDGQKVLFAYSRYYPGLADLENKLDKTRIPEDAFFHLYEIDLDGQGLRKLTHGKYDHFDGRYLPDGQIVFLSTRRGDYPQYTDDRAARPDPAHPDCYVRCGGDAFRPVAVYTLHRMDADGENVRQLSPFEMFEWEPSIDNEGRVIYSRWDYVDREAMPYMSLWSTSPDGTGARAIFGNYTINPHCVFEPRAIPGSRKFVFTASAHHANTSGSLVLLDPSQGTDGHGPLTRLTPEVAFPEIEAWPDSYYANPYPLSEDHYLVAWSDQPLRSSGHEPGAAAMGIYLYDAFGNLELLWRDARLSCMYPLPVRPRARPPQLPSVVDRSGLQEGRMLLADVYRGMGSVPRGTIRSLRIVAVPPKSQPDMNSPEMGLTIHDPGKLVLGTVPVEEDGSAWFRAPSGVPFFFQALDADGMAVQTMRSATYLQPGEEASCVGCHESRRTAPPQHAPLALAREPSAIRPGPEGSWPLDYAGLVQPVLDRHCVSCHQPSAEGAELDLTADKSYQSLTEFGSPNLKTYVVTYHRLGGSPPGSGPARDSAVVRLLRDGHYQVSLQQDEWSRLATWMDTYAQRLGSYTPDQERQIRQLRHTLADLLAE